jgi:hypothetical protein
VRITVQRSLAVAGTAVALALAAGCGGDDGPSAEDYVRQGNEVCREAVADAKDIERPTGDSSEAVATYANAFLPIAKRRLEGLRALEPAEDDARFHERLIEEQERYVAAVETLGEAAGRDDRATAARAAEEGARSAGRSTLLYRELGLDTCAASSL